MWVGQLGAHLVHAYLIYSCTLCTVVYPIVAHQCTAVKRTGAHECTPMGSTDAH
jgi:hypothetical protein